MSSRQCVASCGLRVPQPTLGPSATFTRTRPIQTEIPLLQTWWRGTGGTGTSVAITDHNRFTGPIPAAGEEATNFLQLGGEEITNERSVHVNGIGINRVIEPQKGATVTQILQSSLDAVRQQRGVAIINHPNFLWAFAAADMRPLRGTFLLETASGHPAVNEDGDGRSAGTEQMWDELLSAGMRCLL